MPSCIKTPPDISRSRMTPKFLFSVHFVTNVNSGDQIRICHQRLLNNNLKFFIHELNRLSYVFRIGYPPFFINTLIHGWQLGGGAKGGSRLLWRKPAKEWFLVLDMLYTGVWSDTVINFAIQTFPLLCRAYIIVY